MGYAPTWLRQVCRATGESRTSIYGGTWRARAYNGGLGRSPQRGPAAEPLVRGSRGRSPPEAESILALGRPTDTANLHPWPVALFSV